MDALKPILLKIGLAIVALAFLRVLIYVFYETAEILEERFGSRRVGIAGGILTSSVFAFIGVLIYLQW